MTKHTPQSPHTSPPDLLSSAKKWHLEGDFKRAEQAYRKILRSDPRNAEALHWLGVAAQQQGRIADAIEPLRRAIAERPDRAEYHTNLGVVLAQAGQIDAAIDAYERALLLDPRSAFSHFNLAALMLGQGNILGARTHLQQATAIQPNFFDAWMALGRASVREKDFAAAIPAFQSALALQPQNVEVSFNLGNTWLAMDRLPEAAACFATILKIKPDHGDALNNLGTVLCRLGKLNEAAQAFAMLQAAKPQFAPAYINASFILSALGRHRDAEAAARKAIAIQPESVAALNNLGSALNALNNFEDAIRHFRKATMLDPLHMDAWGNLATACHMYGDMATADSAYQQALSLDPDRTQWRIQQACMLPPVYDSMDELIGWRSRMMQRLGDIVESGCRVNVRQEVARVNFYPPYQGMNDVDLQRLSARLYSRSEYNHLSRRASGRRDGRIRIGFLSKHFYNHTIAHLYRGLIAGLDRRKFQVIVICTMNHQDAVADDLRKIASEHVVLTEHLETAAARLRDLDLDVLFYPDLGMDPATWSLAFQRFAPVQCVSWGHPVTTGIPTMDYFISSSAIEPVDAQSHYSEQLVLLDSLPAYYSRQELTGEPKSRAAYGIPEPGTLYCCPQTLFKFHPEFDAILAGVLAADPSGYLAVIKSEQQPWTVALQNRLRRTLGEHYNRVVWLGRMSHRDFLNLIAISDVMLDPLHFGGGNTTYQAMSVGTPVVTLPAAYMRGRATAGCYQLMGINDCIATSIDDYVAIAVKLGTDREYRRDVSRRMIAAGGLLFDNPTVIGELERFFEAAVSRAA